MKKSLLFAALLFAGNSFAQGLTQANEPIIGTSVDLFLCDSFATNYSNITGSGVTWDYSSIGGYQGQLRTLTVVDPTTTPYTTDFPGATKAIVVENFLTNYWTSSATERNSPGFVFNEPTFGVVKAIFNQDEQKLATYEFGLGNQVIDNFAGSLSFDFSGLPQNPAATGNSFSKIDGEGTLKLNASTTLTGVIRCVTIDTLFTTLPIVGNVHLIRAQYEYYQLATGNMPVFTHTYGKIISVGATVPLTEFTVVLSAVQPDNFVSVSENKMTSLAIYPNPATSQLIIQGNFSVAKATITDHTGKVIQVIDELNSNASISIEQLPQGIYFFTLKNAGKTSTQKFVKM
jgi:hypothetical protein